MKNNDQTPESLKSNLDYKGLYIYRAGDIVKLLSDDIVEGFRLGQNTKLFILTQTAQITAEFLESINDKEQDDKTISALKIIKSTIAESVKKEIIRFEQEHGIENIKISNLSQVIHLKNATVSPLANPNININYKYLAIFSDQVVGLSFAEHQ